MVLAAITQSARKNSLISPPASILASAPALLLLEPFVSLQPARLGEQGAQDAIARNCFREIAVALRFGRTPPGLHCTRGDGREGVEGRGLLVTPDLGERVREFLRR